MWLTEKKFEDSCQRLHSELHKLKKDHARKASCHYLCMAVSCTCIQNLNGRSSNHRRGLHPISGNFPSAPHVPSHPFWKIICPQEMRLQGTLLEWLFCAHTTQDTTPCHFPRTYILSCPSTCIVSTEHTEAIVQRSRTQIQMEFWFDSNMQPDIKT